MRQLAVEAEEHARFASTLNSKSQLQNAEDYERELRQLRNQQKKDRRDADEVSHIMVTECQQLLKLFGLPYVTAPMEAEAQCAELVNLGLVDGIVTDDSDIFLFGGTRVYKNMFNQGKFVECYLASDLERILPRSPETNRYRALTGKRLHRRSTLRRARHRPRNPLRIRHLRRLQRMVVQSPNRHQTHRRRHLPFRRKFKRNATKLILPPTFPDKRVDIAYLSPDVDSDPSPFAWGVPDLDALRAFLMATIGWNQERTDEVLVPVIRDMNRRENEGTQANITNFFTGSAGVGAFAPRRRREGRVGGWRERVGGWRMRWGGCRKGRRCRGDGDGDGDGDEGSGNDIAKNNDVVIGRAVKR
jgi:DNA excision repair protein ERCC-5